MRFLTSIIFMLLSLFSFSQTRKMDNIQTGKNYAVANQSRTVQPLLIEAERKFRALDYDGTFLTLENAIAQNPFSPEALVMRARFRKMVGMQSEAENDLRLANRINPLAANLFGYYGNGGLAKILSVEPQDALTKLSTFQKMNYYYKVLDSELSNKEMEEKTLNKIEHAIIAIENNQMFEANEIIDTVLLENPNSAVAHDLRGIILRKQGKFEEALDAFSKAVKIQPDFAIGWYNLAQIEKSFGHFENAKKYLDKAISLQGDLSKAYFERALVLKKLGETDKAIEDYNNVIAKKGEYYIEAYLNRGLTKKMLGDYGGALADLDRAIDAFPENAELWKNRGNLRLLFGLPRKAIDDYTQAIRLNENYAEAYYNRALSHFLLFDKISGCYDLNQSADLGYQEADKARSYFCSQY